MSRRNYNTFIKKQKAEKKRKAKLEKKQKREAKKDQETSGRLKDMMAYVDDEGNIVSVDPDEDQKDSSNKDATSNQDEEE